MGAIVETIVFPRDRILASLDKLPPFSPVLTRLLATLADEDVSFAKLAGIIETDAVLAGNLLRVVNSALYGRAASINSVRHAVSILGSIKIRNMVLGLSVTHRWAGAAVSRKWDARQFNAHSLAVAVLSDLVALEAPVPYPEGAFTAGLLHDVGKLLIAVAMPEEFEKMCEVYEAGGDAASDCELDVTGITHAEISGAIMERWKLPKQIQEAVAYHHSPDLADAEKLHLAHLIEAADHYVNMVGFGTPPYRHHPVIAFENCYPKFGLEDCILKVADAFHMEFEIVRSFV
jgi:putative nucleotidyltransferase with HDIG domain